MARNGEGFLQVIRLARFVPTGWGSGMRWAQLQPSPPATPIAPWSIACAAASSAPSHSWSTDLTEGEGEGEGGGGGEGSPLAQSPPATPISDRSLLHRLRRSLWLQLMVNRLGTCRGACGLLCRFPFRTPPVLANCEAGSLLARLPACLARHAKKLEREMHREQGAAPCQKQSRCSGFFLASDLVWCAPARNVSGVWLPRIWGSIQLFLSSSTRYEPSPTVYHVKYRLQDLTSRGLNAQAHGSLYSFYFSLVYTLHVYKAMYLCLVSGLGLGLGLGSGVAAPRIHLA